MSTTNVIKKRQAILLASFCGIGLFSFAVTWQSRVYGSHTQASVLTTISYKVSGGQTVDLLKTTKYTREDGTYAIVTDAPAEGPRYGRGVRKIVFPSGKEVVVSDDARAKSTTFRSAIQPSEGRAVSRLRNSTTCAFPMEVVGARTDVAGNAAIQVTYQSKDNSLFRFIDERLPDYNCEIVSHIEQTRRSVDAPWTTTVGTRLVSLKFETPSPELFVGFDDFAESAPTELAKRTYEAHGLTRQDCPDCFDSHAASDQDYMRRKVPPSPAQK